jgi:hypothetical protein
MVSINNTVKDQVKNPCRKTGSLAILMGNPLTINVLHNPNRIVLFKNIFLVCPIWLPVFFLFFYNEPELGVGIDPGMALTQLPSSIGQGLNPRPSDREPCALPLDHSFCLKTVLCLLTDWSTLTFCVSVRQVDKKTKPTCPVIFFFKLMIHVVAQDIN